MRFAWRGRERAAERKSRDTRAGERPSIPGSGGLEPRPSWRKVERCPNWSRSFGTGGPARRSNSNVRKIGREICMRVHIPPRSGDFVDRRGDPGRAGP
ncbi:MAG: hypothetical protein CL933_16120 [Deltaproteobacteria bacterium]|nr:hypothetical protein [Deltaproteobacteria bacterium]